MRPGGHQTLDAGRAGHQTAGQLDPGRGNQTTGNWTGWTPDGWTTGPQTTEPDGLDTEWWTPDRRRTAWQASWHSDHRDDAPTAGMPSGSSAGQTPPGAIRNRDSSAEGTLPRAWPPPRPDSYRVTF